MASPFRVFRKHQKVMLATLGLAAMISFVFIPMCLDQGQVRTRTDPVVVSTTSYGDLQQSQLQMLIGQRQQLLGFLEQVQGQVQQAGGQPMQAGMLARRIGEPSEESVVTSWLLANEAERLGLVVDNLAINEVLRIIGDQRITDQQIKDILRNMQIPERALFDMLRPELLALRLQELFHVSLASATPAQRWDYFQRLNRKAKVEVAAIPVAGFVDQVADPDQATLQEFFEKYKAVLPNPTSPDPGFRVPRKVALEYFRADYEKFVAASEVSDEDVKKYYEEHKENYKRDALPALKEPAAKPAEQPKAEEPKAEEPKAEEPKPEEPKPEEPKSEEPKSEEPAEEKPAESAEPKPSEPAAPPKDSSSSRVASPFQLASYQQEGAGEAAASDPKPEEKKPEEKPAEQPAPAKPESAAEPPKQPAEPDKPAVEAPKSEAAPGAAAPAGAAAAPAEKPVEYLPLEEVRDEIRRQLAGERARQKIKELFDRIQDSLTVYHNEWTLYDATQDKTADAATESKAPVRPDFQKLAEGTPLEVRKTDLIPAYELFKLDIGKAYAGRDVVARQAYATSQLLFRPTPAQDTEGNFYLFWKTEESEERVPELSDPNTHKQVLLAWKAIQARSLAKKEADRLADEARKANKPLKEVLAGQSGTAAISEPEPFSWLNYGSLPQMYWGYQPPVLSDVPGVEMAGEKFMETVFRLQPGAVGVATNHPQTAAYVVRIVEFTPSPEVLWTVFLKEDFGRYAQVAMEDAGAIRGDWLQQIKQSAGLEWKRDPTPMRERASN